RRDRRRHRHRPDRRSGGRGDRTPTAGLGRHPRRHDPDGGPGRRGRAGRTGLRPALQAAGVIALLLLLLQEPAGEASHAITPFSINPGLIIWTLVVFGILLAILWKLGWPALLKSVEEREARIAKQLADAERANAEAARLLEEHKAALTRARTEAQEILATAKGAAQKEREQLLARTREEQEQLLERARRDIESEKEKASLALRREAVELSIAAATKLVGSNLDSDANRRLVMEYLASLEAKH